MSLMNFSISGLSVVETEAQAVFELSKRIDQQFEKACELLLHCEGRIVVTGMGKSGHIANKIASTFASTGSPAFFMHPGEASHGDLGMLTRKDILLAISHSGSTQEILTILPLIKRLEIPLISLTGNKSSFLAQTADVNLDVSITNEACPLGLAPTTSTTVALVMGDALAVALLQARGFNHQDFALSHPGGSLGKRLILTVADVMHKEELVPQVNRDSTIREALFEVTAKKLGMTCITDDQGILVGIYTDGDIRRTLTHDIDIHTILIKDVMTSDCRVITPEKLAVEALNLMQKYSITALVCVNEHRQPLGVVHLHDLLRAGII
jgi:arabinose-5-phosphate isomerase